MSGKLLVIDLTSSTYHLESLGEEVLSGFLGGRGLGAYLLYKYLPAGIDPLAPENPLIISAGPAQGTNTPYSSRSVLNTKSPQTGIYLYSVASGSFGHNLRKAGLYALVIRGKAARPTCLVIRDAAVEFRDGEAYWGMKTCEAHNSLLAATGLEKASCLVIGPAGEKQIPLAAIVTEGRKARTFGRGGAGAVMGSKNLKGIVLAGSGAVAPANAQAFKKVKELMRQKIRQSPKWAEERRLYGTGADVMLMSRAGLLPTRNWQSGTFAQASGIAPTELGDFWPTKNVACAPFCISPCSHVVQIDRGPYRGATSEGPEYETIYVFGSNCGVARFDAIVAAEEICDAYGLDTMSTGAAIGFAMECFERGLIGREDTGGVELRFGDDRAMLEMVRQMATDTGFGSLLNRGVRHASRQIPGSERFAMHMKGMEPGGYECRAFWGQALQFALNSRGGCHHGFGLPARTEMAQGSGRRLEGKGQLVKSQAIDRILYDSIAICTFPRNALGQEVPLLLVNALLGTEFGPADLHRAGFRTLTLERLFNVREGISRKDDTLPPRLLEEPLPDGPGKGSTVPLAQLLDDGYQSLGWSAEGIPLPATLRELGLNWALQDLPGEPA